MSQRYAGHGIGFEYPESWTLQETDDAGQVSLTLQSSGTSFWSLNLYRDGQEPTTLIETAIDAFRVEYEDLDVYEVETNLCLQSAVSRDLDFVCMDLVNSAYLRAFRAFGGTILVLYQVTDCELEETLPILEAISESLSSEIENY